jgi:hypothetical protein
VSSSRSRLRVVGRLSRRLLVVAVCMNADLVPVHLGKIHIVVLRSLPDIRESELSIGFGHIDAPSMAKRRV